MTIHEAIRQTGLTRKAIEYYIEQGLICPEIRENGYRTFGENEIARLQAIAAYRKLGISVAQIRRILGGEEKTVFSQLLLRQTLASQREKQKLALLESLASGSPVSELSARLRALEAQESIAERLLLAFPGYFGQYFALHFAHFLQSPIETDEQERALETIVSWLDGRSVPGLPDDLKAYLDEAAQELSVQRMDGMHAAVLAMSEDPQAYLTEHEEAIRAYIAMKDTQAYKASPAARLMEFMKDFQRQNGYEDVFIPAMERLSPEYAIYRQRLKASDRALERMLKSEK